MNPTSAPNTNKMHVRTQADMEVSPSTLGELLVMLVKILIRTRNRVTRRVIRPGTISGGIRKLAYMKSSFEPFTVKNNDNRGRKIDRKVSATLKINNLMRKIDYFCF